MSLNWVSSIFYESYRGMLTRTDAGAGTGIVSLTIGALRSATQRTDLGGKIITTDLGVQ